MPALTAVKLENHARHAIGGEPSSLLNVTDMVNEAGERLVNMHPWSWLVRDPANLTLTQDQAFVTLPSDFRGIKSIWTTSSINDIIHLTTIDEILHRRGSSLSVTNQDYWVALAWPTQTATTSAPSSPRLELWPTPAATDADAWAVSYYGGWIALSAKATSVANIPEWLNPLLVEFVRAVARGYEDENGGTVSARCKEVSQGQTAQDAMARDGEVQQHIGPIQGGHRERPPTTVGYDVVTQPTV